MTSAQRRSFVRDFRDALQCGLDGMLVRNAFSAHGLRDESSNPLLPRCKEGQCAKMICKKSNKHQFV